MFPRQLIIQYQFITYLLRELNHKIVINYQQDVFTSICTNYSSNSNFKSISDSVLAGNVISTYNVTSHDECLFHCYESKGCQSYNYQYTLHNSGKKGLCEISNKTMASCPKKKRRKEGHGYFEEVNTIENRTVKFLCKSSAGISQRWAIKNSY